jgi:hypothetical protein
MNSTTEAQPTGVSPPALACVSAVDDVFASVLSRVEEWRTCIERLVELDDGIVSSTSIDTLVESMVVPELERPGALEIGGGFVATPGFLADADWHLAWWLGDPNSGLPGRSAPRIRRLFTTEDPTNDAFRDYTTLEWWRVPAATRSHHVTGPYVDYLCTDDYTLTLTAPVTYDTSMIGVVGADLYVTDVERAILPHLRAVAEPATLVNASGRVIVSTDPHLATGALLRVDGQRFAMPGSATLPDGRRAVPCGTAGFALVLG